MSELKDEEDVAASVELMLECRSEPEAAAAAAENPNAITSISLQVYRLVSPMTLKMGCGFGRILGAKLKFS